MSAADRKAREAYLRAFAAWARRSGERVCRRSHSVAALPIGRACPECGAVR